MVLTGPLESTFIFFYRKAEESSTDWIVIKCTLIVFPSNICRFRTSKQSAHWIALVCTCISFKSTNHRIKIFYIFYNLRGQVFHSSRNCYGSRCPSRRRTIPTTSWTRHWATSLLYTVQAFKYFTNTPIQLFHQFKYFTNSDISPNSHMLLIQVFHPFRYFPNSNTCILQN